MVLSMINSILCRSRLSVFFIYVFLFYPSHVNVEGSTCSLLLSTGKCANAIVVTIDEKSAKEETSFSLYYYPAGKKKLVAELYYDKSYSCHPTNGYNCTKTTDVIFNINLGCATLQNVTLEGDGQQPVTCIPMENSSVESTNNNHNCTPCANDTAPGNSVSHSRQKRCACPNGSPESSADNRKPDDTGGERGNPEVNVIGIIVGIAVTSIVFAIGVVFYCTWKLFSNIMKGSIQYQRLENC